MLRSIIASSRNRGGVTLDTDAVAYADAVVAAGGTVSSPQRAALSAFVAAEKAASRWSTLKRLFLPIWADAEANAIDLKTLATGTWVGTVTHSASYVTGNGTTGYFNAGASPVDVGMTIASGLIGCLRINATGTSKALFGANGASSAGAVVVYDWTVGSGFLADWINDTTGRMGVAGAFNFNGIVSASVSGGSRFVRCRNASGIAISQTGTPLGSGSLTTQPVYFGASNNNGAAILFNASRFGAFFMGEGLSSAASDGFSENLKTLWEALTGLTLP